MGERIPDASGIIQSNINNTTDELEQMRTRSNTWEQIATNLFNTGLFHHHADAINAANAYIKQHRKEHQ